MPRTTRSRTTQKHSSVLERDPGFEALGAGIAPGLPGEDRSERERAEIGAGQPRRGAPAADPLDRRPLSSELIDEAVESAAGRRRLRQALGVPSDRRISNEVIDELLAGASTEEEIAGPGGLLAERTRRLVDLAMEVELTDHGGYEAHQEPPGGDENTRNGTTPKTLICEHGKTAIDAPRDRDGSFQPQIVRKRQRRFQGFDDKILALYSRGLSTRDIEAHLQEIYGVNVGRDLISRVTDGVMDDVRDWAKRPLEDIYPIVFLDCMVLKIRSGDLRRQRRPRPDQPRDRWGDGRRARLGQTAAGGHLPDRVPGLHGAEDPRGRHGAAPRALPRARGHLGRRPRRAGHVVPRDRGREVLDAGPHRSQAARRSRHPDRVC